MCLLITDGIIMFSQTQFTEWQQSCMKLVSTDKKGQSIWYLTENIGICEKTWKVILLDQEHITFR